MEQRPLAGLEPACVFRFFEEICAIPHGSRNTKTISDYLVRFAQERGLRFRQDEWNNVVIFQPGTPGYEDHSPVILQGHMDMVCEKEPDCPIDFEHDGLDLTHDGTDIFARGTTLGGDDGVAVAAIILGSFRVHEAGLGGRRHPAACSAVAVSRMPAYGRVVSLQCWG